MQSEVSTNVFVFFQVVLRFQKQFSFLSTNDSFKWGKKRHIYLVSKAVKGILESSAEGDELKVEYTGQS